MSYIDTSRGLHFGRRREDVYNRRPGDGLWRVRKCGLWIDLLDHTNDIGRLITAPTRVNVEADIIRPQKRLAAWQAFYHAIISMSTNSTAYPCLA